MLQDTGQGPQHLPSEFSSLLHCCKRGRLTSLLAGRLILAVLSPCLWHPVCTADRACPLPAVEGRTEDLW